MLCTVCDICSPCTTAVMRLKAFMYSVKFTCTTVLTSSMVSGVVSTGILSSLLSRAFCNAYKYLKDMNFGKLDSFRGIYLFWNNYPPPPENIFFPSLLTTFYIFRCTVHVSPRKLLRSLLWRAESPLRKNIWKDDPSIEQFDAWKGFKYS